MYIGNRLQFLILCVIFFSISLVLLIFLFLPSLTLVDNVNTKLIVTFYILLVAISLIVFIFAGNFTTTPRIALGVFIVGHVYWFAWPATLAVLQLDGAVWYGDRTYAFPLTNNSVLIATVSITVFFVLTGIIYSFFSKILEGRNALDLSHVLNSSLFNQPAFIVTCCTLLVLGLLPFFVFGDGITNIIRGILGSRSIDKAWEHVAFESNPIAVIGRSCMVLVGGLALVQIMINRVRVFYLPALLSFLMAFIIVYLDSGTRTWTALLTLPPILMWLVTHIKSSFGFPVKRLILPSILIIFVVIVAQVQVGFRNSGFSLEKIERADLAFKDNDFYVETIIATQATSSIWGSIHESTLLVFLANPIPRSLWENKPYPRVIREYSYSRDGFDIYYLTGISRLPSIVGQYYMNWGIAGIVMISIFYGAVLAFLDYIWIHTSRDSYLRLLWAATATVWLFFTFRGLFPGFHYPLILLGLLVIQEAVTEKRLFARRMSRLSKRSPVSGTRLSSLDWTS